MAKVLLKKSSVSSNAPGTGDLDYGELAINYADGRLYYKNSSNQIKNFVDSDVVITQIDARTPLVLDTTPQLGGDLETNGNDILFADNDKAIFGTGRDLQIYHNGSNSYIDEQGTGLLFIRGSQIRIDGPTGSQLASFSNAGTSVLFYNGSQKLSTNSVGVGVTGLLQASSISVTGNIGVTGTVDGRDIAADGSKLDGIEAGATGDQTASEILTAIKTVDGATSGLDADLLDGQHGSYYRIDVYDASGTLLN